MKTRRLRNVLEYIQVFAIFIMVGVIFNDINDLTKLIETKVNSGFWVFKISINTSIDHLKTLL